MGSLLPIFLNDIMIFCSWLEKSTYAVLRSSAVCYEKGSGEMRIKS